MLGFIGSTTLAFFFRGGLAYIPLLAVIFIELFICAKNRRFIYRKSEVLLMASILYFVILSLLNSSNLSKLITSELILLLLSIVIGFNAKRMSKVEVFILNSTAYALLLTWSASFFVNQYAINFYNSIFVWGADRVVPSVLVPPRFYEPFAFLFILMFSAKPVYKLKNFLLTVPTLTPWTLIYLLLPTRVNLSYFIKMLIFTSVIVAGVNIISNNIIVSSILEQKVISFEQRLLKIENIYPFNFYGFSDALDYSETFLVRYSQNFGYIHALVFYGILNYCLYERSKSVGYLIVANIIISANPFPIALIFAMALRWKEYRYG